MPRLFCLPPEKLPCPPYSPHRVKRVKPSPTVALTGRVARLKAEGHDIIGLGVGEPDFDTPAHIAEAGIEAIQDGATRYTAVEGIPELKDAIIAKFQRDNGLTYTRSQILVSVGAKQTIYNFFMAIINPGDEVVIPAPYWVSYPDMALLADGVPVMPYAGPEQGYKITAAQLEAAITPRTRVFMLNSPSNPTGAAYSRAELETLGAVLRRHPQVLIATDDMYEHIYWAPEPFCSLVTACPDLYDRTVTINGVSKSYAMTGWRIGYCGGPADDNHRDVDDPEPEHIEPRLDVAEGRHRRAQRRPAVRRGDEQSTSRRGTIISTPASTQLPGFKVLPAAGTFYAFCDVSEAIRLRGLPDDNAFAEFLLERAGVAGVPGSGFGAPRHMRFSFAVSMQTLEQALARVGKALARALIFSAFLD